jgi:acyl-CoA dehydrogenase
MDFEYSPKTKALQEKLLSFMEEHIYPNEEKLHPEHEGAARWTEIPKLMDELKAKARQAGLWNLFLPESKLGAGLTNVEYAPLCEIMGRSPVASEIFNCSAPDTGNMEVLERYGSEAHKKEWLEPLLKGEIRSAFAMTEPAVASSDATNIATSIKRDGDHYVIDGLKWWTSGAGDPRCRILIVMGQTDPKNASPHKRQSMILCPLPHPGVSIIRPLTIFGFDDAPHGHMEVKFDNVRVPASNLLLGEGRGFEIAQGRLGPGRIHHCMRVIGATERALERLCRRLKERTAFGAPIATQGVWLERIAQSRVLIDQSRLLTLHAAYKMDTVGNKEARADIAAIKVVAGNMACQGIDWAIQGFGGGGFTDRVLARAYAYARTVRMVDGPDEVHRNQIAKLELRKYGAQDAHRTGGEPIVRVR